MRSTFVYVKQVFPTKDLNKSRSELKYVINKIESIQNTDEMFCEEQTLNTSFVNSSY